MNQVVRAGAAVTKDIGTPSLEILRPSATRIESIDLLRGLVIILMTLDHVRDYFHADSFIFDPLDLDRTTPAIFLTRWVTHFCAPVFVFLAGTSAFIVGARRGRAGLSSFLLKRGIWLIVLEFTVVNFGWFFNIQFDLLVFQVIAALGAGMIILSAIIWLPFPVILILSITIIAGHNLLDKIHVNGNDTSTILWAWIHEFKAFEIGSRTVFLGYPILPWSGVMMLGYCFGWLYVYKNEVARRRMLLLSGLVFIAAFVLIRFMNNYGEPFPWTPSSSPMLSTLSFINLTKYPPSLLYCLVTLGPALLFLAVTENIKTRFSQYVLALGRAPLLYYILHVYVIHLLAMGAAVATGFSYKDMIFTTWITDSSALKGYGFSLSFVYLLWIFVVAMLLPVCMWYETYKRNNKQKWWLSYL